MKDLDFRAIVWMLRTGKCHRCGHEGRFIEKLSCWICEECRVIVECKTVGRWKKIEPSNPKGG